MTALTARRLTDQFGGVNGGVLAERIPVPIDDNVSIQQGALVQTAAGFAVPAGHGSDSHTYVTIGRAANAYDNTIVGHAQSAATIEVDQGCFLWDIGTSGDALTQANVGTAVYAIDDHTVGATSGSSTRAVAGKMIALIGTQAVVQTVVV